MALGPALPLRSPRMSPLRNVWAVVALAPMLVASCGSFGETAAPSEAGAGVVVGEACVVPRVTRRLSAIASTRTPT